MDWDNLRFFLALARAGQFVAAARALKVDHATVNRRITALEKTLNARLVDRRTTGVGLTAAGQVLLRTAEALETGVLQAQAALTDTDVELSGTVRIGAPDGFSTAYLAPRFASFVGRHPAITIQLVPSPQVVLLAKREIDIAIVLDKPQAGRYVTRKLTDYTLGIFGAESYLARHGTPTTVAGLRHHRLIGYVEDYAYASAVDYVGALRGRAHRLSMRQCRRPDRGRPGRPGSGRAAPLHCGPLRGPASGAPRPDHVAGLLDGRA